MIHTFKNNDGIEVTVSIPSSPPPTTVGIDEILTFQEATALYGLSPATLQKARERGNFQPGEIRRSAGVWLVTRAAMYRLYGERECE